ncbi:MAG: hypothetical protein FWD64_12370 [Acidobacteriaceae bacterium]|nr:hypothetical protein [Acidobacteriaceae bacterium]
MRKPGAEISPVIALLSEEAALSATGAICANAFVEIQLNTPLKHVRREICILEQCPFQYFALFYSTESIVVAGTS